MDYTGKKFGDYTVDSVIGKGGMGLVLRAFNINNAPNLPVAIKVLDFKISRDDEFRKRFRREADVHASLSHPNTISLIEYIETQEDCCMVMEYFPSKSLSAKIGKETGPVPYQRAIPIFLQILKGMDYLHKKNIIHRDLKPSNILINEKDEIKIIDFGIAKSIEEDADGFKTKTGVVVGTPYYMAPEQIKGFSATIQSDIYSLGITFFETLAGKHPFDYQSDFDIRNAQVNEIPKPPSAYYPHIPMEIENIVMKAIHKDPLKRFQSCQEMLNELLFIQSGNPENIANPVSRVRCQACGAANPPEAKFCMKCGTAIKIIDHNMAKSSNSPYSPDYEQVVEYIRNGKNDGSSSVSPSDSQAKTPKTSGKYPALKKDLSKFKDREKIVNFWKWFFFAIIGWPVIIIGIFMIEEMYDEGPGFIVGFVGLGILLRAFIEGYRIIYYGWALIEAENENIESLTPAGHVVLNLIPLVNIVGVFVSMVGWAKQVNHFINKHKINNVILPDSGVYLGLIITSIVLAFLGGINPDELFFLPIFSLILSIIIISSMAKTTNQLFQAWKKDQSGKL
jgi:serine/threonine protein kinase